jgi:hypothetical protein
MSEDNLVQSDPNEDKRPLFLKDAIYQGELHSAPYALTVSSPKIEPIDKGECP